MALFPPWVLEGLREGGASFRIAQGYSFILSPPNNGFMVHVDLSRFLMQCIPIVIIIGFVLFLEKRPLCNAEIKGDAIKSKHYGESFNDSKSINICPGCGLINPDNGCDCGYDLINHKIKENKANFKPGKIVKWLIGGIVWLVVAGLSASLVRSCSGSLNKPTSPLVQAPTSPLKETLQEPVKTRFTKAKDGVISDSATDLEWYVGPDQVTNGNQAKSWAESLTVAGGGWRMPIIPELKAIYQQGAGRNNMDSIFQTNDTWVWARQMGGFLSAGGFDFTKGQEGWAGLGDAFNSRAFAVRSREGWENRAEALGKAQDWEGMLAWCLKWSKSEPGNYLAWLQLGVAYANLSRYKEASEAYQEALRLQPDSAEGWYNLGVAYENLGRYREAIEPCLKALRLKPNFALAWSNLGVAYANLGRYKEAIEADKEVLRFKPDHAAAWHNLGLNYTNLGRYKEAIEAYQEALRLQPNYAAAWNNLAFSYAKSGNHSAALEAVKELRRYDPQKADELLNVVIKEQVK